MKHFIRHHLTLIIISSAMIISLLLNGQNISSAPIWQDDYILLKKHTLSFQSIISTLFHGFELNDAAYWRPLTSISFLLSNSLPNPIFFAKAINLVLYLISIILILKALLITYIKPRLSFSKQPAFIVTALLLISHPFWVEPVQWTAGRFDLLGAAFFSLFLIAYFSKKEKLSFSFFILALLSKDALVVFLPALIIFLFVLKIRPFSRAKSITPFRSIFILIILTLIWAIIRYFVLAKAIAIAEFNLPLPLPQKIEIFLQTFYQYSVRSFIAWPNFSSFWVVDNFSQIHTFIGAFLLITMPLVGIYLYKKKKNLESAALLGLWLHFLCLSALNVINRYSLEAIGADRYALIDLYFIGILMLSLFQFAFNRQKKLTSTASIFYIFLFFISLSVHLKEWSSSADYWVINLKNSPFSATAARYTALALVKQGDANEALNRITPITKWIENTSHANGSVRLSWNAYLIAQKAEIKFATEGSSSSLVYLDYWINKKKMAAPPILAETSRQLYLTKECNSADEIKKVWLSIMTPTLMKDSPISTDEFNILSNRCYESVK